MNLLSIDVVAMFMLGLAGTGHCMGMCGPLVVALPGRTGRLAPHGWYHAGRIATYTLISAVMGGLGAGLTRLAAASNAAPMVWMARGQTGMSILAASLMAIMGLARLGIISEPAWMQAASPLRWPGLRKVAGVETGTGDRSFLAVGLVLGLLPCGLSYAAFARALAGGGWPEGALMGLIFGLGTLPGLALVGAGAGALMQRYRPYADPVSGMIMIAMAASLAGRLWMMAPAPSP